MRPSQHSYPCITQAPKRDEMIEETISAAEARCFYDALGENLAISERFEQRAKEKGLAALDLRPGLDILNVGVGSGREQSIIQERIAPGGVAFGIDLSRTMLRLSQKAVTFPGGRSLCEADARRLPFATAAFDRIFSSYMLDLIPASDFLPILREMRRVLAADGHLVLVSLTRGITLSSRALMAAWTTLYRLGPTRLGGCRPVRLAHPLLKAGFSQVQREVIIQWGMPSELLVAYP